MSEKRVIHFRRRYLGGSETFIHTLVTNHQRWRPVVVTGKTVNEDIFPVAERIVLRGDEWPMNWLGRACWKLERFLRHREVDASAAMALLEMQAMGKPVVATRHADIPYVVREGESAVLADEGDVEGLAAALVQVATTPERWAEMGRAGRAQVEANHDVTKEVPRLELLYDELTA